MTVELDDNRLNTPAKAVASVPAGLLDHLPAVPFRVVLSPDGRPRVSWMAGSARRLLGLAPEAVLARPDAFWALLQTPDADDVQQALRRVAVDHSPEQFPIILVTAAAPHGTTFHLALTPATVAEGSLAVDGLLTEAPASPAPLPATPPGSANALAEAESRFRQAFQASPGLFAISDPDTGRHLDVNDRWLSVMGWRRDEVIGRTASDLGVWAEPRDRDRLVARLKEFGAVRDFETRFRTRSGTEREFLVAGEVIEMDGEKRLLLVAHDVTERNNAQRALGRMNAELEQRVEERTRQLREENLRREEIQRRLEAIMDGVADAIIVSDGQGRIQGYNAAAERLFGWTMAEAPGMPLSALMPEPYASRHEEFIQRYRQSGESSVIGMGRELPAQRKDGSIFPVEIALSHLCLAHEDVFIAAIRDITDRREQEDALRAAKEAAETANQAKSAFLSSMSHELRTPMNAILGFAQLMEVVGAETLTDTQRDYLGHILSAGKHLLTLINDVLDLSKIEAGRVALSLEPVAVNSVIDGALGLLTAMADRHDVAVQPSEVAAGLPHVWTDHTRLGQVLLNLVTNAVKYNRPGGTVRITAGPSPRHRDMVELAVTDTGPGIPADRIPELFVPFNRLGAEGGTIEGTGIGLSIAKQLVEMMGGRIGCDSTVGEGSTFWIDLPPASAEDETPRHTSGSLSLTDGDAEAHLQALSAQAWTILYIEDNPPNLRLVANLLGRFPAVRMLSAPTAEIGLDLAAAHRPDLVIMDLNLPGADGYEALMRLRNRPETETTPVIALTARVGPREQHRGMRAGFDAYLTKPLDLSLFLREIDRLLGDVLERRWEAADE